MDRAKNTIMYLFLSLTFTILVAPALVASQVNSTLFISKGCYYDNFEYAVLPDLIKCESEIALHQSCINSCSPKRPYCQSNDMTVQLCFRICTNQNARYFGLQDGSQCLCGGAFAPYDSKGAPPDNSSCSKNCTGNPGQICGGGFQIFVYEIKDPASVSDCFHPGYLNIREDIYPPVIQEDFHINDTLDYSTICQSPSNLAGTPTITCTENSWSGPPPMCTIRCSPPDPRPYVDFELVMAESFDIGETVSYTCLGNTTTFNNECKRTGLWSPIVCPVMCAKTALPHGGALATTSNVDYFAMGALVDFVCDGVSLSFTFECGSSGNWNITSFTCQDTMPTAPSPPTTPGNDIPTTLIVDRTMTGLEPTGSTTAGVGRPSDSNQGWVIAVAVIVPLLIILIVIVAIICYRKRKEEQNRHVPQVVLGYIKKKGTLGGTLRRNRDPEKDLTDNPEGDSENVKKDGTLTHSLSSMKQQFVKRVTLSRNRPELPPKKNPKNSSSRSFTRNAEVGYVSPKAVRTASEVDMRHPNPPMKRASTVSVISSVDNGLNEIFKSELRSSRSSEMLDALMMEFDGRVNHGYDNEESSARSSPSLALKNSPTTEHVVVHTARSSSPKADTPEENGLAHNTERNGETESLETASASQAQVTDVKLSNGEENSIEIQPDSPPSASEGGPKVDGDSEAAVNGTYLEESPYDSLGEPKPAPAEISNVNGSAGEGDSHHYESTIERNRPAPLTLNTNGGSDYATLPGPESPQYATLADVQSPNGGVGAMGSPGSTTATPTKHDYVNVGRGNSVSATRSSAEFHHPRPPSLPPDSP